MTHPLFCYRTPTAAMMGMTQKEMYAHAHSQAVTVSFLREQLTILANTVEAQAHNCTTTDAMLAQMKYDMKELNILAAAVYQKTQQSTAVYTIYCFAPLSA